MAQAIGNYLKAVGINVKLSAVADTTFLTNWLAKKLSAMYLFSIQRVELDASGTFNFLDVTLATFSDPKPAQLYRQQLAELDANKRKALISELSRLNNDQAYYTPLFTNDFNYVYRKKFNLPTPPANGYPSPQDFVAR
jgi:ABC-type transport system substrate-binding protein